MQGPGVAAPAAATGSDPARSARDWTGIAAAYGRPDTRRSIVQVLATVVPLAGLWLAMALVVEDAWWLALLLAVPTAAFLVRLFMIQHDCGHRSYFRARRPNDWLGRAIGVLTLTPHDYWRRAHNIHHATSGLLDKRGIGDLDLLTVREYLALPRLRRLAYRAYRHPLTLFGIGPLYVFFVKFRLPLDVVRRHPKVLVNVMFTNLAILGIWTGLVAWLGFTDALLIQAPVIALSSSAGVWLFYVQHQFETTWWRRAGTWDFHEAAIRGSSWYDLPRPLRWLTADIGIHHIHHLSSRIPNYRLGECLADNPGLRRVVTRITLLDSLKCMRLALWDEATERLVRFSALKKS